MKLVIFGANGGIGKNVIEQGLEAGHEVTAVVRRPETITIRHERLKVLRGNVLDPSTVQLAIAAQDAVLSTIGTARSEPTTIYSEGVANILQAMGQYGVRRFICISASGLDPGPLWQRLIAKPLLWRVLKDMYIDLVRMETIVKKSAVDWTIIRPPRLSDGPRTGRYNVAINEHLRRCFIISRADLAAYMLSALNDRATYCGMVEVAQ
jgi:putative NADH-flavin reductase